MNIDLDRFVESARKDFEFKRETRYLTGVIKLEFPDAVVGLHFRDGEMLRVDGEAPDDADCKIVVRGTGEQWGALLEDKPRPFYQCLQSAAVRHGLHLSNGDATFAYLPALNRMTSLMRASRKTGAAQ